MLLKDNKYDRLLYYTGYIGSICIERVQVDPGSRLASYPRGSFISLAYHYIGCLHPLQQYTVLMQGVVIHLERFDSVAESGTWNQKWRVTSLTLTLHITYCLDDFWSTLTELSLYSAPMLQIYGGWYNSTNGVRWETTVQRGEKLLY